MIYALADKIKQDCIAVMKDYNKNLLTGDFKDGIMTNAHAVLEDMEDMWDVDLSEYFVEY